MIIIEVSGGLGNQMFGYAFAKALSIEKKDKLCISKRLLKNDSLRVYGLDHFQLSKNVDLVEDNCFLNIIHIFRYNFSKALSKACIKIKNRHIFSVHDSLFERKYIDIPYSKHAFNIYRGLYQNAKYFDAYRQDIVNDFTSLDVLNEREKQYECDILESESVCLHIRRGDYVHSTLHNVCTMKYYKEAVLQIKRRKENLKFFVFSDDIEYAKKELNIENAIYVDRTSSDYIDLHLMMKCKNFIISNSTFSWWAQYLSTNEDKMVFAPSVWLSDEKPYENGLYLDSWICIDPY